MKISGEYRLSADRQAAWDALQDPAILVRTLPVVQRLEVVGPDRYAITAHVGVGAVKGTYQGEFSAQDKREPESCVLRGSARGTPGAVEVEAFVRMLPDGGGTLVAYEADAKVSGPIAGVGQRMMAAAAKKTTAEFFSAVEEALANPAREIAAPAEEAVATGEAAEPGRVFTREAVAAPDSMRAFAAGVVTGAAIALAGVVVGRWTGRSR